MQNKEYTDIERQIVEQATKLGIELEDRYAEIQEQLIQEGAITMPPPEPLDPETKATYALMARVCEAADRDEVLTEEMLQQIADCEDFLIECGFQLDENGNIIDDSYQEGCREEITPQQFPYPSVNEAFHRLCKYIRDDRETRKVALNGIILHADYLKTHKADMPKDVVVICEKLVYAMTLSEEQYIAEAATIFEGVDVYDVFFNHKLIANDQYSKKEQKVIMEAGYTVPVIVDGRIIQENGDVDVDKLHVIKLLDEVIKTNTAHFPKT